jgi:uncharacterized protein
MEVDADRKRIALSMRMSDEPGEKKQGGGERGGAKRAQSYNKQSRSPLRQQSEPLSPSTTIRASGWQYGFYGGTAGSGI